jgi:hypothetical protein
MSNTKYVPVCQMNNIIERVELTLSYFKLHLMLIKLYDLEN